MYYCEHLCILLDSVRELKILGSFITSLKHLSFLSDGNIWNSSSSDLVLHNTIGLIFISVICVKTHELTHSSQL